MKRILLLLFLLISTIGFTQTGPSVLDLSTIENIAALRALVPPVSKNYTAVVDGYTTRMDGGGGSFQWSGVSTLADNGGTVIKPTSFAVASAGRWLRDCDPNVINVRHFGAIGDCVTTAVPYVPATHTEGNVSSYTEVLGAEAVIHEFTGTDDTTAFQLAYATMDSGKTLYVPPGSYLIDGNDSGWSNGALWTDYPGMRFVDKSNIVIRGEGPSSNLCVSYDLTPGDPVASDTFRLFEFEGSTDCTVRDLSIDFQSIGWSTAIAAVPPGETDMDLNTRLHGSIFFGPSATNGPTRNKGVNLKLRTNHPFGGQVGAIYDIPNNKYSAKLFAFYIHGTYEVAPSNNYTLPATGVLIADSCEVDNCTFYNGQPYSVMMWMTQDTKVRNSRFLKSAGKIPAIRAPHLNNRAIIEDNYFEAVPNYTDGGVDAYNIFFFNNSGGYMSRAYSITRNNIVASGTGVAPIYVNTGSDFKIDHNTVIGTNVSGAGIRAQPPTAWTAAGDAGQVEFGNIESNTVRGFPYGILSSALTMSIDKNTVSGATTGGIYAVPHGIPIISMNQVFSSTVGIIIPRGGTTANAPANVVSNVVRGCGVGLTVTNNASTTHTVFRDNIVMGCSTGTTNLSVSRDRLYNNFFTENTADGDATLALVATASSSIGSGTYYGDPSNGY